MEIQGAHYIAEGAIGFADVELQEPAPSIASITSSVLAYQEGDGRRYHAVSHGSM